MREETAKGFGVERAQARLRTRTSVLDQLESVSFLVPPRPVLTLGLPELVVAPLATLGRLLGHLDLYHAIPSNMEEGQRALALLHDVPGEVDSAVLEMNVGPPELAPEAAPADCKSVQLGPQGPPTRDWSRCQGYLDGTTAGGLGAREAWGYLGGAGRGVVVVDIEKGFNADHEDLVHVEDPYGAPRHTHGTMSLGVCCGNGNTNRGIRGVSYCATPRFVPVEIEFVDGTPYPLASLALKKALPHLHPGDVVLLEMQASYYTGGPYNGSYFPIERSPDVREAIGELAKKNVYVVQAAGNGNVDLDAAGFTGGSEAIIVGGGTKADRRRWTYGSVLGSNYGSRVDVQGWGEGVVTTGERTSGAAGAWADNLQRVDGAGGENRCYTQSFNGTSSAAAMVAGAVACLSGILKAHDIDPPCPDYMRKLLVSTGTCEPADATEQIGPLPDLRRAIAQMEHDFGTAFRPAAQSAA